MNLKQKNGKHHKNTHVLYQEVIVEVGLGEYLQIFNAIVGHLVTGISRVATLLAPYSSSSSSKGGKTPSDEKEDSRT